MTAAAFELALDLKDVAKTYKGKIRALRGVSMQVHPGEVFGLLGPNGAGKSTLVKILLTIVRPTRSAGTMLGRPLGAKDVLRRVGYLPERLRFPDYLTGAQALDYTAALAEIPASVRRARAPGLLERVGLADWGKKRIRSYSKGMKQRLGIAQALMNEPDLIFLDEPTDGLDPVGRREVREIVQELKARGCTVFLNSHILSELEGVCDRIAILVKGQVVKEGRVEDLASVRRTFHIELADDHLERLDLAALSRDALGSDRDLFSKERSVLVARTEDLQIVQSIIDALRARNAVIRSIVPHRPSLEDLFMEAIAADQEGAKP